MKIIDEQLISGVVEQAKKSPRLRMNYNFHESLQDKCHRFLNALEPGTFIPADVVSLEFLLQMFFKAIDPTSLNKQGHDEGTRYRTGIYYTSDEDLPVIEKVFAEEQKKYQQPLAVEKLALQNFYSAEEYHQDYLDKGGTCDVDNIVGGYHPTGYCHLPESLFEFARKAREKK